MPVVQGKEQQRTDGDIVLKQGRSSMCPSGNRFLEGLGTIRAASAESHIKLEEKCSMLSPPSSRANSVLAQSAQGGGGGGAGFVTSAIAVSSSMSTTLGPIRTCREGVGLVHLSAPHPCQSKSGAVLRSAAPLG